MVFPPKAKKGRITPCVLQRHLQSEARVQTWAELSGRSSAGLVPAAKGLIAPRLLHQLPGQRSLHKQQHHVSSAAAAHPQPAT